MFGWVPANILSESDEPLVHEGRSYQWMQILDVPAGRDTTLDFTAENAEVEETLRSVGSDGGRGVALRVADGVARALLRRDVFAVVRRWLDQKTLASGRLTRVDPGGDRNGHSARRQRVRRTDPASRGSNHRHHVGIPPVLIVRARPKFMEHFWTTVGRVAASTRGVSQPQFRKMPDSFARMRVYFDEPEVAPIRPFRIERRLDNDTGMFEGL